jgi:hypothetical protein
MSGENFINVLEPKLWSQSDNDEYRDNKTPKTFSMASKLSQHISFLKDFFKSYKDFEDRHLDTLEILITKLYWEFGIRDKTNLTILEPKDYPLLFDLYKLVEAEYENFDSAKKSLYTENTLRELALGLNSICVGSDSKFFNGHTNITDDMFVCIGVKGLLETNKSVKDAMLFNVLSYMSNELLTKGNTVMSVDELYLFLTNLTAIEYIRNFSKRVRKKNSAVILASQNIEDFDLDGIREYTKPLFAIPTHTFLFNAGNTNSKFYMDSLQVEQSEYDLIKYPSRGSCLYKCGNERYNLQVIASKYKSKLFGMGGGR